MILIACGLQRESKILTGPGVIAIPGGGNAVRLEAALETHLGLFPDVRLLLSCGIAGALDPALVAGDVVVHLPPPIVPSEVEGRVSGAPFVARPSTSLGTNGSWEDRLKAALPQAYHGLIIGQDHIAVTTAEKAALAATGALAVDMESHIAARVAARHGLPFIAIRTISDTAQETLPPAALVGMNPDGSMALGKVLWSLARTPGQLPALIRTGQNAERAFKSLARVHATLGPVWARLLAQGSV